MELDGPRELEQLAAASADLVEETSVLVTPQPLVVHWPAGAEMDAVTAGRLQTAATVTAIVGRPGDVPPSALAAFDVCLTEGDDPPAPWVTGGPRHLDRIVTEQPLAAVALVTLLRAQQGTDVWSGVVSESAAYAALLGSAAFRTWRTTHARHPPADATAPAVLLDRDDNRLTVTLNRSERHNALDTTMRDELVSAFQLAALDETITAVDVRGAGPSFCSGGDLDEFGTVGDPATAHAVRLTRHPGWALHRIGARVCSHLHGACIGAGIEIPAFGARLVAAPDSVIALPEVSMGLIPGAGGTVSITRRVGRQRCAWLALSCVEIDAVTAHRWGLVDALEDRP